jgi:hypothetical protein
VSTRYRILILGASYGSLLATKLLLAGHDVKLVCLPDEADLINSEGIVVRMPVKGKSGLVEVRSSQLAGSVSAAAPEAVDPSTFDLVALAMQEPQYRSPNVRLLLNAIAHAKVPCMSIMNMPPLTYLARIPSLVAADYRNCYTDPAVWDNVDPALLTLCSPDPQAFRPPEEKINVLQVSLPTNFKAARFASDQHTQMLRALQADIESARFDDGTGPIELPVKLKVYDSVFVPLAKWCMLITGNYRCIQKDGMRSIRDAVHGDIASSRTIYNWVGDLCKSLGAAEADLVPFEKYASAAAGLDKPSSAARGIASGATQIERVDMLLQSIAARRGLRLGALDDIVATVNGRLEANRRKAA